MKSIQIGSITVAEIMYAKWGKNVSNMRSKRVNLYLCAICFHAKLKYIGATVLEFHFFNQIKENLLLRIHVLSTYYIKFTTGVNYY